MESVVETLEDLAVLIKMKVRKFLRRGDEIVVTYTQKGESVVFWISVPPHKNRFIVGQGGSNIRRLQLLVQRYQSRFGFNFFVKVTGGK